jgi:hypothetical protein
MIRRWWLSAVIAFLVVAAPVAHAQRALDRDTVTRWIAAAQEVQAWAEEQDDADLMDELSDDDGIPHFARIERGYSELYESEPRVRSAARGQGFRSADEWGNISARITMGLMHLGRTDHGLDEEIAQAMREMEEDPDITPQMRDMIRQQMQQAMGNLDRMTEGVQEADLPILREMQSELRAVIEGEEVDDDW